MIKDIENNFGKIVVFFLFLLSLTVTYHFVINGQNLLYADSISRLNIARKVIDNINPGLPQLGNVWLPLPQIVMIPFIWSTFFWHTGLAGTITSTLFFVLGGYFVYKSAYLISKSILGSVVSLLIYALNINLLYLQTTAMSETLFLCTLSGTIYFFLKWFKTNSKLDLVIAAFFVSAMTLTRYEGLSILLSSIPMVFVYSFIKSKKFKEAEGNTIIYSTLAVLGFVLWTLYLTAIFGDPLYWIHYYATPQAKGDISVYTQAKPFLAAATEYLTSFVWMIGLIPTILAFLGVMVLLARSIKTKTLYFLPSLMPLVVFLFMILTLQKNTPVVQPELNLANILSGETSRQTGFNIRYGILLLPWVAIVTAYLFEFKSIFLKVFIASLAVTLLSLQVYSYFYPKYSVIYQIPARIYGKPYVELVDWFKKNYTGGKILISASSHEDQMFQMGFNYSTYIHEGAGKYWKESLDNPSRYATYVVIDYGHPEDQVARHLSRPDILERDYNLLYEKDSVKVFKIKTQPYFKI